MDNINNLEDAKSRLEAYVNDVENQKNILCKEIANGESSYFLTIPALQVTETLHTSILGDLLNPDGIHGCGGLFLKKFCETIGYVGFRYKNSIAFTETDVRIPCEKESGKLDILIISNDEKQGIIIENKINAGDIDNQMKFYHEYCKHAFKDTGADKNYKLIYLTLSGNEPNKNSKKDLKEGDYCCIGYEKVIIPWLEECKKEILDDPSKKQINLYIQQYINILHKIITPSNKAKNNTDILLDEKKLIMENCLFPKLKEEAKTRDLKFTGNAKLLQLDFCKSSEGKNWKNIIIRFEFETIRFENLGYGFFIEKAETAKKDIAIENLKKQFSKNNLFSKRESQNCLCWTQMTPKYRNWTANTFVEIAECPEEIATAIFEKIDFLLEKIKEANITGL